MTKPNSKQQMSVKPTCIIPGCKAKKPDSDPLCFIHRKDRELRKREAERLWLPLRAEGVALEDRMRLEEEIKNKPGFWKQFFSRFTRK